jgi:hypothetical protein
MLAPMLDDAEWRTLAMLPSTSVDMVAPSGSTRSG